jgi:sigma-B regulation protein RsbU (phosphoserine phosphatase)
METSKFEHLDPDSFVTVFLGVADPEHHVLTYASAGHEPVFLLQDDSPPIVLPPTGPIIGVFEEWPTRFHQRLINLKAPGSTLLVTTDGVTEARSRDGDFFFEHPMLDVLEENRTRGPQEQAQGLLRKALDFCDMRPHDDIAIVAARFS